MTTLKDQFAIMKSSFTALRAVLLLTLCLGSISALSQQAPTQVKVGAAECPPFVINAGGKLSGLGIFLWDQIAREMGVEYDITLYSLGEMLEGISSPKESRLANVGVSCISITAEREKFIDFSHSFFETYIGIAVKERGFMATFGSILSNPATLSGLAIFLGIAALVGLLFYLLEHGANAKLYTAETGRGKLVEALLVGMVFITRGPINFWEFRSLVARVLATLLALGATFLIAGITAVLASAFTLESLRSQVNDLQDLAKLRVGALESSTSAKFLTRNGIPHQTRPDLRPLIDALEQGRLDAVVSDAAVLRFTLKNGKEQGRYQSLSILPYEFDSQNYGFALEPKSEFVEEVNQALLTVRKSEEWKRKILEYLGE
jgi:polar amino acid transport system substrate-binding protein